MSEPEINSVLAEARQFPPPSGVASLAHISSMEQYEQMHTESIENPARFWAEVAADLHWFKKWDRVLEWTLPDAKWFVGGRTNLCYNCVDRQVKEGFGDKVAIIWEGEPVDGEGEPEIRRLTYNDLLEEISLFANVLKTRGVKRGDRVTIYMPMVPELAIAMLACARIGAAHSIIFGGFSSSAIVDRVNDAQSNILITSDGAYRRGKVIPLKDTVDEALTKTDLVKTVITLKRTENDVAMKADRDFWWHDEINAIRASGETECPCEEMDSEDLLFILYTSGTTGKPKGSCTPPAGI